MEVYLDNNSTTPIDPVVKKSMMKLPRYLVMQM